MSGLTPEVSPEESARVSAMVVRAAFDSLVSSGLSSLAAASVLSAVGSSRRSLSPIIEELMPNPGVYEIEVEASTHDLLQEGVTAMRRAVPFGQNFSVVCVSERDARSDSEAMLIAAQMAACTSGGMPTKTTLISFPTG